MFHLVAPMQIYREMYCMHMCVFVCVFVQLHVYGYMCLYIHAHASVGVITAGDVISERSRHEESRVSLQQAKPVFHI